jgi:hypothetical protein
VPSLHCADAIAGGAPFIGPGRAMNVVAVSVPGGDGHDYDGRFDKKLEACEQRGFLNLALHVS